MKFSKAAFGAGCAALVAAGLVIVAKRSGGSAPTEVAAPSNQAGSPVLPGRSPAQTVEGTPKSATSPSGEARLDEAALEKIREEIQEASIQYSESELPKFAEWLKSPNAEVRAAAATGLLDSGVAGGAVLLRDAAAVSKNPEEVAEFTRAAEILELPPATDLLLKARRESGEKRAPRRFSIKDGVMTPQENPEPAGQ